MKRATYDCADCGAPLIRKENAVLSDPDKPLYCYTCWKRRNEPMHNGIDKIRNAIKLVTEEHGLPPTRIAMHHESLEALKQEVNRTGDYILKMLPGGRQMKCLELLVVLDNDLAIGDIRLER